MEAVIAEMAQKRGRIAGIARGPRVEKAPYTPLRERDEPRHERDLSPGQNFRKQLSNVLVIGQLRGVLLPDLLAGLGRLFADNGECARVDPAGTHALSLPLNSLSFCSWSLIALPLRRSAATMSPDRWA